MSVYDEWNRFVSFHFVSLIWCVRTCYVHRIFAQSMISSERYMGVIWIWFHYVFRLENFCQVSRVQKLRMIKVIIGLIARVYHSARPFVRCWMPIEYKFRWHSANSDSESSIHGRGIVYETNIFSIISQPTHTQMKMTRCSKQTFPNQY